MEESMLYDLLSSKLYDYREKLQKETDGYLSKHILDLQNQLKKSLNEEQFKLVDNYKFYLALREEDIDDTVSVKLLNYGVKIGMQLQKAFNEEQP